MKANNTYIAQGEHAIGNRPDQTISAVLGSCVAVCLWDNVARVGGMNHILLPDTGGLDFMTKSAGAGAMEILINGMLKRGARKEQMGAKYFGGAAVVAGLSSIGRRNAEFVHDFLTGENIAILGKNVGGNAARRVQFWPESGLARIKAVASEELEPSKPIKVESDMELF